MSFRLGEQTFSAGDIILFLSCCNVCIAGHESLSLFSTCVKYAIFILLVSSFFSGKMTICPSMLVFFIMTILATILNALYHCIFSSSHFSLKASFLNTIYYLAFVYCGFFIAVNKSKTRSVFKAIRVISITSVIIISLQYVCAIAGFKLNRITVIGDILFHAVDTKTTFRPSAFFSEPSHLAELVLIDLFYSLFCERSIKFSLLDLFSLVASTSALGIVLGYGMLVYWVFFNQVSSRKSINLLIRTMLVVLLFTILNVFLNYSGNNENVLRILKGSTLSVRTLRAFEIYSKFEPLERVFGIGLQNLSNYINFHGITLVTDRVDSLVNKEYAQTFGYILCSLGILGSTALLILLGDIFFKLTKENRAIVVFFFFILLTCNVTMRPILSIWLAAIWQIVLESKISMSDQISSKNLLVNYNLDSSNNIGGIVSASH